jgi:hypothetical protein
MRGGIFTEFPLRASLVFGLWSLVLGFSEHDPRPKTKDPRPKSKDQSPKSQDQRRPLRNERNINVLVRNELLDLLVTERRREQESLTVFALQLP